MNIASLRHFVTSRAGLYTGAALGAAATAAWTSARARRAEREHPPAGRFVHADGVDLHYVDVGAGPAVVLLHGNAVSHADFEACGLISGLAQNHRVLAFDRPGFGYSERPRDRLWTPATQARALMAALRELRIEPATVIGHSMGTLIGLTLALDHAAAVRRLILLSGYYYPAVRFDALAVAPVALPVLGDAMRYTVTAVTGRILFRRMVEAMFAPLEVPAQFVPVLSREMMLRPSQLRANAEDAAFMMPGAADLKGRYKELHMPVTIIAGTEDGVVDASAHSARLHGDVPQSELILVPQCGHMVHYTAGRTILDSVRDENAARQPLP